MGNKKEREQAQKIFKMFADNVSASLFIRLQSAFSSGMLIAAQLYRHKEGIAMTDLASSAACAPSRVTAIIGSWEEEGTAERFQKEGDRLHTFARLTRKGRSKTETRFNQLLDYIAELLAYLGPQKAECAIECLASALEFTKDTEKLPCLD